MVRVFLLLAVFTVAACVNAQQQLVLKAISPDSIVVASDITEGFLFARDTIILKTIAPIVPQGFFRAQYSEKDSALFWQKSPGVYVYLEVKRIVGPPL